MLPPIVSDWFRISVRCYEFYEASIYARKTSITIAEKHIFTAWICLNSLHLHLIGCTLTHRIYALIIKGYSCNIITNGS